MPKPAQDRLQRGPLAALLILLGLFLGTGTGLAAASGFAAPAARSAPARKGPAAILASGQRDAADSEPSGSDDGAGLPPAGAVILTRHLWARPLGLSTRRASSALSGQAGGFYRARAPPAF